MSSLRQRRLALQLEREELRLRCAAQRSAWLRAGPSALPGLAWAARAEAGARLTSRWLRAHPGLAAAGAAAALLLLRPRRVLGWAGTLLTLWSLWQRAQPLLATLRPRDGGRSGSPPRPRD
jgi:hypothetical protein